MKSLKFKLFIIAFFGIYLAIIISNIIKKEKLKEEYTLELLNFGEILTDIEIYDKRGLTRKGRVYKNYYYKFFIEGKRYRGIIEIPQKENNPNFVIGNPLTILYSERDPEIHSILKINNQFTVLPTDTVSYIIHKRGTKSKLVIPTIELIEAFDLEK